MERPDGRALRAATSNPLLSTAVTGVSLQDLTHHAVLLPAIAPDELSNTHQSVTPRTSKKQPPPQDDNANRLATNTADAGSSDPNSNELQTSTKLESKPDAKPKSGSNDDFDVNEYFARLQGTRYVSAPLNSAIKEDKRKLEEAEENLEEINLDESRSGSSPTEEVQQSLTADIAHNFSQLPQTLPRVASAVFSSFSSILNLNKSKEPTPDPCEQSYGGFDQNYGQANQLEWHGHRGYPTRHVEETQQNLPTLSSNVSQMPTFEEAKPVGPPPIVGGPSNTFRMVSKKKTYAHIPGLSSTQHPQMNLLSVQPTSTISKFAPPNMLGPPDATNVLDPPKPANPADLLSPPNSSNALIPESSVPNMFIPSSDTYKNVAKSMAPLSITPTQPNVYSPISEIQRGYASSELSQRDMTPCLRSGGIVSQTPLPHKPQAAQKPNLTSHVTESLDVAVKEVNVTQDHCSAVIEETSESLLQDAVKKNYYAPESHAQSTLHERVVELMTPMSMPLANMLSSSQTIPKEGPFEQWQDNTKHPPSSADFLSASVSALPQSTSPYANALNTNVFPTLSPPPTSISALTTSVGAEQYLTGAPLSSFDALSSSIGIPLSPISAPPTSIDVPLSPICVPPTSVGVAPSPIGAIPISIGAPPTSIGAPPKGLLTSSANRSLLPPSVARRLANSQPVLSRTSIPETNIFAPSAEPTLSISDNTPVSFDTSVMVGNQSSVGMFLVSSAPRNDQSGKTLGIEPFNVNAPQETQLIAVSSSSCGPISFSEKQMLEQPLQEVQKPVFEPPKMGAVKNFRLGSKRPQYYSGPIEGAYSIGNSFKPVLEAVLPVNITKNVAMFTPVGETNITDIASQNMHDIQQSADPVQTEFDLSRPVCSQKQQEECCDQYRNAEFSQTNIQDDSKSDLIGSIKSKLGSVNINKLQSAVTSFFDPAYYYTEQKEDLNTYYGNFREGTSKIQTSNFEAHEHNQQMYNLEISMPSYECKQVPSQEMYPQYTQDSQIQQPFYQTYGNRNNQYDYCGQLYQVPCSQYAQTHNFEMRCQSGPDSNIQNNLIINQREAIPSGQCIDTFVTKTGGNQSDDRTIEAQTPIAETYTQPRQVDENTTDCFDTCSYNKIAHNSEDNFKENDSFNEVPSPFIVTENSAPSCITNEYLDKGKPEILDVEKTQETDITSLLIENLTSPFQLVNPAEAPLTEETETNYSTNIDNEQMSKISQITEQTIETLQLQTSAELFDKENKNENFNNNSANIFFDDAYCYCWSVKPNDRVENQQDFYCGYQEDKNEHSKNVDSIFRNASDEIKAELQKDEVSIIPRQISTPSTPPLEDIETFINKIIDVDTLDVNLIEQDAKKDFADLLDPCVIEPSETDDDKLEKEKPEDYNLDNTENILHEEPHHFAEHSQNLDLKGDPIYENIHKIYNPTVEKSASPIYENVPTKSSPIYENVLNVCENVTSPVVSFASYFDTGNHASDNHLRNIQIATTNDSNSNETLNRKKYDLKEDYLKIGSENHITKCVEKITQDETNIESPNENIDTLIEGKWPQSATVSSESRQPPRDENLADPMQFFSSVSESKSPNTEPTVNPLASYFGSPEKSHKHEPKRSFFELSEGQDHYMHPAQTFHIGHCQMIYDNCLINQCTQKSKCVDSKFNSDIINIENANSFSNIRPMNVETSQINNYSKPVMFERDKQDDEFRSKNSNLTKNEIKMTKYFSDLPIDNSINCTDGTKTVDNNNSNKLTRDQTFNSRKTIEFEQTIVTLSVIIDNCKLCKLAIGVPVETEAMDSDGVSMAGKDGRVDMDGKLANSPGARGTVTFEDFVEENEFDVADGKDDNVDPGPYSPVKHHWYYRMEKEEKMLWKAFSYEDSDALEIVSQSSSLTPETLVPTNGGRYDVRIMERLREAVYWTDKTNEVRRCSWFCKGREGPLDSKYVPYEEDIAELLESEYRRGCETGEWHRRVMLPNRESVVLHGPRIMLHLMEDVPAGADSWSSSTLAIRPRVVRRGTEEHEVESEPSGPMSHLLLLCHGIGSACDLRFRHVEEVVDDFRASCQQLIRSHYKQSYESGAIGRVEVLPVSWHTKLHTGERGVDARLAAITLDSIPRLRGFTNDTVLDVLFYTSPLYCQLIMDIVSSELERIYKLFRERNPGFKGGVSFGGHSLGSVILFDLLSHQLSASEQNLGQVKYAPGAADTVRPSIRYPQLSFKPDALYALGSPIAIFQCIRGVDALGLDFRLPTCGAFFNIFHPYDPIAYRIEPLLNPELKNLSPFLIPHHKGRKRMHLELKETMARVGADIKQRVFESLTRTWASMWKPPANSIQQQSQDEEEEELSEDSQSNAPSEPESQASNPGTSLNVGRLNGGRRVDYVLQEAPFELINEYLSAVTSHVCYWESSDVMLLMLREIYSGMGVAPDSSVPQQSMTVEVQRSVDGSSTNCS